jgi:hypothetical protein
VAGELLDLHLGADGTVDVAGPSGLRLEIAQ